MDLRHSYFSITSPLEIFDRWLHPYICTAIVSLRDKNLLVNWTKRADQALKQQADPLLAEMQLYFSCVVKKRVLFHSNSDINAIPVNPYLNIIFRTVQASSCNPDEFAKHYPVEQDINSAAANRMCPSQLNIDFKNQAWVADFSI